MISVIIYNKIQKETDILIATFKELALMLTDEVWNINTVVSIDELDNYTKKMLPLDLNCMNLKADDEIYSILQFRKNYKKTKILIITDVHTSPMKYLRPGIMASALLVRPFTKEMVEKVSRELVKDLLQDRLSVNKYFLVDTIDGKISIPYEHIYFFEAREKKIYMRTLSNEYCFYHTLEKLQNQLPENFIRTHRSFIVNGDLIRRIMISQGTIILEDDFHIPLSRMYKAELKRFGNEKK